MTVNVGFVGVGGIAQTHLDTIATSEDAAVAAVFDVVDETAERAADRWNATIAADLEALVSVPDLDAVFVCVPPDAHGPPERAVAEYGLDLFVEKPVAIETETAVAIAEELADADILTQAGHHWRYAPGIEHGRALLADRTIGYLDGRWWGGVPGGPDHWWGTEARSGGQVIEQAIHIYDTVRYVGGEVESVQAAGGHRIVESIDFPDVSSATLVHENGTVSHVSSTSAAEEARIGVEVVAQDATLSLSESQVVGTIDGDPVDERYADDPYEREVHAFIEGVRTGSAEPLRSPYEDSVRSLAVAEAVTESMRRGEHVEVAEFLSWPSGVESVFSASR